MIAREGVGNVLEGLTNKQEEAVQPRDDGKVRG
jgi:hypothetical protein